MSGEVTDTSAANGDGEVGRKSVRPIELDRSVEQGRGMLRLLPRLDPIPYPVLHFGADPGRRPVSKFHRAWEGAGADEGVHAASPEARHLQYFTKPDQPDFCIRNCAGRNFCDLVHRAPSRDNWVRGLLVRLRLWRAAAIPVRPVRECARDVAPCCRRRGPTVARSSALLCAEAWRVPRRAARRRGLPARRCGASVAQSFFQLACHRHPFLSS